MRVITEARRALSMSVALWAAALGGCEEATMVGSGCPNGVCPNALSRNDDACTTNVVVAEIAITLEPGQPVGSVLATICLPSPLTRNDDGRVNARVYYFIPRRPPIPAQTSRFSATGERGDSRAPRGQLFDMEMCDLNQLAVTETDGGA